MDEADHYGIDDMVELFIWLVENDKFPPELLKT